MEETVLDTLRKLKPQLRELFGITELAVFGSCARGENTAQSDVDIVILTMEQKNGLTLARAKRYLAENLGKEVDIGLYDALRPFLKRRIARDLIHV